MCMDKNYFLSITHTEFVVVIYVLTNVPLKFHSKWSRTFFPQKTNDRQTDRNKHI